MATNFEVYKDEIIDKLKKNSSDDSMCTGRFMGNFLGCVQEINDRCCNRTCKECWAHIFEILQQEHVDQPKLTKRERAFCEAVQTGWIIDFGGIAYWTNMEPVRSGEKWHFNSDSNAARLRDFKLGFEWLGAHQSCKVEDLLKLDVVEVQHEAD